MRHPMRPIGPKGNGKCIAAVILLKEGTFTTKWLDLCTDISNGWAPSFFYLPFGLFFTSYSLILSSKVLSEALSSGWQTGQGWKVEVGGWGGVYPLRLSLGAASSDVQRLRGVFKVLITFSAMFPRGAQMSTLFSYGHVTRWTDRTKNEVKYFVISVDDRLASLGMSWENISMLTKADCLLILLNSWVEENNHESSQMISNCSVVNGLLNKELQYLRTGDNDFSIRYHNR